MTTTKFKIAAAYFLANYYKRHPEKEGKNVIDYVITSLDQDDPNQINSVRLSFKGKNPTTRRVLDLFKKKYNTNTHFLFSFEWDEQLKKIYDETLWDANASYIRQPFSVESAKLAVMFHLFQTEQLDNTDTYTSDYFVVGIDNSKELSVYATPLITSFDITDNNIAISLFQERPHWENEYLFCLDEESADFIPLFVPEITPILLVPYDKTDLN